MRAFFTGIALIGAGFCGVWAETARPWASRQAWNDENRLWFEDSLAYDAFGQRLRLERKAPDHYLQVWRYRYDSQGRHSVLVTDNETEYRCGWDSLGELSSWKKFQGEKEAASLAFSAGASELSLESGLVKAFYAKRRLMELVWVPKADSLKKIRAQISYDSAGRLSQITYRFADALPWTHGTLVVSEADSGHLQTFHWTGYPYQDPDRDNFEMTIRYGQKSTQTSLTRAGKTVSILSYDVDERLPVATTPYCPASGWKAIGGEVPLIAFLALYSPADFEASFMELANWPW